MTNSNGINVTNALLAPLGVVGALLKPRQTNLLQPNKPDEVSISKMTPEERQAARAQVEAQAAATAPIAGTVPTAIQANFRRVNRQEDRTNSQAPNGDAQPAMETSADSETDTE